MNSTPNSKSYIPSSSASISNRTLESNQHMVSFRKASTKPDLKHYEIDSRFGASNNFQRVSSNAEEIKSKTIVKRLTAKSSLMSQKSNAINKTGNNSTDHDKKLQYKGIKRSEGTNHLNNIINFKEKLVKQNTKTTKGNSNHEGININEAGSTEHQLKTRFYNLGAAPNVDIDAEIRKNLKKKKKSKSPHKRNASVYQKNFRNEIDSRFKFKPRKIFRNIGEQRMEYTTSFKPYTSSISRSGLGTTLTPDKKRSRVQALKYQEETNPKILNNQFYFTEKIIKNKPPLTYLELRCEFNSKIMNTASTRDKSNFNMNFYL